MVVVEYFYVSVLLCLRLFKYLLWYSGLQNGTHAFPWAGFTAHTLAGSDVGSISRSSFAAKRRLTKSCEENDLMHKRTLRRLISVLAALAMGLSLLTGCGAKNAEQVQEQEDAQTIQVYLWSTTTTKSELFSDRRRVRIFCILWKTKRIPCFHRKTS